MSEKIYAWLLRLYPPQFREAYSEEALQLFRDRARDEKGFLPGLRLWLDLLADLAISIPREYRSVQPALIGGPTQQRLDGLPSFYVLERELPPLGALLFGGVVSLVALSAISLLISHVGNQPFDASVAPPQPRAYEHSSSSRRSAPRARDDAKEEMVASGQSSITANCLRPGEGRPSDFRSNSLALLLDRSGFPQPQAPQPKAQGATSAMIRAADEDAKLDVAERQRVIAGVIANLKEYYVYPDVAQKMADALLAHEKSGDDNAETDGDAFADLLTRQMRDVSHDRHLVVVYSQVKTPERKPGPTPEDLARYRKDMARSNCTFERVKILPRNIGYLKFNEFPYPPVCQPTVVAAMNGLRHVDTIIFDLRDNHGGSPKMVALIATYLFDHPTHLNDMYNRRENTTEQSWTLPPVPGNELVDKPAYILTSASTFSGAEEFTYDLKMLKRATLVGETTAGGAHPVSRHRIDAHFMIGVPDARPINPISKTNWEGTGVEPDVKVRAADALKTAEKLAQTKLQKK
jgi:hypothetical protein